MVQQFTRLDSFVPRILKALGILFVGTIGCAAADQAAAFFDDRAVREIRLHFDSTNWYNTLFAGHLTAEDPYFPCRFQYGDTTLPKIGCRFKGHASFQRNGIKKPFKLDFNEYDDDATFLGLTKLNLHNFDLSPDFMREKLLHDIAARHVTALRSVYVRVYVNDRFYGLYLAVEQPDKVMMQSRFGEDEDGNLYEAEEPARGGVIPDLSWLGRDPSLYHNVYLLKTNEKANDYSSLIEFIDVLNNTPAAGLPSKLEPIVDVADWLTWMALNNVVVNLDSYIGVGAEYYLYDRSTDGRFIHIQWDHNESFGITGDGTVRLSAPDTTDPFFLPPGPARPLLTKLWAVDAYKRLYLQAMARLLRDGFHPSTLGPRIDQLANLIRAHVNADPNKAYTSGQFERNLTTAVGQIPGVKDFINNRYAFLRSYLDGQTQPGDIRLNELVPVNGGGGRDQTGDADPWLEIHNLGPGTITLTGYYLSDDASNATKWAVPARTLADGEYLVLWLDGETAEGDDHASFRPQPNGGEIYLFSTAAGPAAIDRVSYTVAGAGQSLMRVGHFGNQWTLTARPSPGAANGLASAASGETRTGELKINEFMADNGSTIQDPNEPGAFEDWFEIYNPGTVDIDMSGMYLTDDSSNRTRYRIPSGVRVPAGGHVVFWADNDTGQGAMHTNFALDADGEQILLYRSDGATLIDSVTFRTQQEDVSFGRSVDGGEEWTIFQPATPGSANVKPYAGWMVNAASYRPGPVAPGSIVSAFGQNLAAGAASAPGRPLPSDIDGVSVSIVDSRGTARSAGLFFVSKGQVNFELPDAVASGRAVVTIRKQGGDEITGDLLVAPVGPGLFSADASGEGVGLMSAIRVDAANVQTPVAVFTQDAVQRKIVPVPVGLGAVTERVYLTLYGTGLRAAANLSDMAAQVGDVDVPVLFAGPEAEFAGVDQVNIGPLPRSLAGKGLVEVELTVNGARANRVTLTIQ